jgi:hypothetical protein
MVIDEIPEQNLQVFQYAVVTSIRVARSASPALSNSRIMVEYPGGVDTETCSLVSDG